MHTTSTFLAFSTAVGIAGFTLAAPAAAGGVQCERVEYAQLKDASKTELLSSYCMAVRTADLNGQLLKNQRELFEKQSALGTDTSSAMREAKEYGDAQVSCLQASEAALRMLQKKHGVKPPVSCK